ncbi:DeoR/GlpR family DNA-binding transcription regulator [Caldibacillus thermoamylovorans]|uniref:DeoR/GlpR family DNA-binding transcription regulator n=1 Tax=Caldibacillus thermoamylovorans TaxID=35841 RepID=UPI0029FEE45E|nr:DeoR/GlpR family DNA-binding transcription regulator [Caldibacillus thermoamylovorans]
MEKQTINIDKKKQIAKKCASLINENDIVFIGSGTTGDMIFDYLDEIQVSVITNLLSVFNRIKELQNFDVLLTGGRYRDRTGTFVGYFSNQLLREVRVNKAFVGTNGIDGLNITTANQEEGNGLSIVLDNAKERFILADSTKFGTEAFFTFYNVQDVTSIITDSDICNELLSYYNRVTTVLKP